MGDSIECFVIEARNERPNPDLQRQLDEEHGGPVDVVDWVRVDTGEVLAEGVSWHWAMTGRAPAGAMFWADRPAESGHYPHGGPNLHVVLPGGHAWNVDMRASNCNRPDDDEHHCWVRHGDPPLVTAGKGQPGESCDAGGGSIHVRGGTEWHGFLRDGRLVA